MYSSNASTHGYRPTGQYGYSPASQTNRGGLTQKAPTPTNPYASQGTSSRPLSQRASVIPNQNTPPASSTVAKSHTTFHYSDGRQPLATQQSQPNTYTNPSQPAPRQQHQQSTHLHTQQGAYADTPQVARRQQYQPSTPQHPRQGAYADTAQVQQYQPSTPPPVAFQWRPDWRTPLGQFCHTNIRHTVLNPSLLDSDRYPRSNKTEGQKLGLEPITFRQYLNKLQAENADYKKQLRQFYLEKGTLHECLFGINPDISFAKLKQTNPRIFAELFSLFIDIQIDIPKIREAVKNFVLDVNYANLDQFRLEAHLKYLEGLHSKNFKKIDRFAQCLIHLLNKKSDNVVAPVRRFQFANELQRAFANSQITSQEVLDRQKKYDALISVPYRNLIAKAREEKGFQWINQLIEAYCQSRGQRFSTINIDDLSGWFERRVGRISTLHLLEKKAIVTTMEEIGYWFAPESAGPRRPGPINWETNSRSDEDLRKMKKVCSLAEHLESKCGLQGSFNYPLKPTLDALTPEMKKRYDHLQSNKSLQDFVTYVPKYFSGVERGWTAECQQLREDAYLIHALPFRADLDQNLVNQAKAKAEEIVFYLYTSELPQPLQS